MQPILCVRIHLRPVERIVIVGIRRKREHGLTDKIQEHRYGTVVKSKHSERLAAAKRHNRTAIEQNGLT